MQDQVVGFGNKFERVHIADKSSIFLPILVTFCFYLYKNSPILGLFIGFSQNSRRPSDSSSSSSESSSSDEEERESRRSKSRSKRTKKERKHRSKRRKHSSSESEGGGPGGPLPLSRFFGSVKS